MRRRRRADEHDGAGRNNRQHVAAHRRAAPVDEAQVVRELHGQSGLGRGAQCELRDLHRADRRGDDAPWRQAAGAAAARDTQYRAVRPRS